MFKKTVYALVLPVLILMGCVSYFAMDWVDTHIWLWWPLGLYAGVAIGCAIIDVRQAFSTNVPTDSLDYLPALVEAYVKKEIAADTRPSVVKEQYLQCVNDVMRVARDAVSEKFVRENLPLTLQQLEITTQQKDLIRYFGRPFVDALAKYLAKLPAYVAEPAVFHSQLGEIPRYKAMEDFHFAFKDTAHNWIYSTYQQRWFEVQRATDAKFYDWGGPEFYRRLTEKAPFEKLFDQHSLVPITIPDDLRFRGVWVIAPPGKGKTTLLSALLKADLARVSKGGASVILMDSKGDLVDHARQIRSDKMVLIEPTPDLAINPLDIGATGSHAVELLEYLFSGLFETAPSEKQLTLLRSTLLATQAIPNATIFTLRELLGSPIGGYEKFDLSQMHPEDREFFTAGKFDSKVYKDTKEELDWRIQSLLTKVPMLRDMFKAPRTRINIGKEMDAGRLIIIDNSTAKLGRAGSEFFGRFFLALTLAAAQQRARKEQDEKLPCFLYIDECDTIIAKDKNIAEMIARCRSQKVGVVLAHQYLTQIKSVDVSTALANCAVRFANSDDEAPELAARMRTKPEHLRSLHTGQFACFMSDLTKEPLTINVPNNPVSKWPKISAEEMKQRRLLMKQLYCYEPDDVPPPTPTQSTIAGVTVTKDW